MKMSERNGKIRKNILSQRVLCCKY